MKTDRIKLAARKVHEEIWRKRSSASPGKELSPIELLAPEVAAWALGIRLEYFATLGQFGHGERFEVAGVLNRQKREILVSERFKPETVRFTAAHEIGHFLLHEDHVMHRDRPIGGLSAESSPRPLPEQEADYFAACYLMPPNLLTTEFKKRFGPVLPFVFNEATAFHLAGNESQALLYASSDSHHRAVKLAMCRSFNGVHFRSLVEEFKVSTQTMVFRLEELSLLEL